MVRGNALLTALCGAALIATAILRADWAAYLAVAAGAPFALASAWGSLRERKVDVNLLMIAAAAGSVAIGHVAEAGILLFLFSLANTLEAYALGKTESAIEGLVRLRPKTASVFKDGVQSEVPVADLRRGDTILIAPFAQVPADCRVLEGESSVDASAMTGESQPVPVGPGSEAWGGTQNLEGTLTAEVTAEAGMSTLDRIVELVREAQSKPGSGERISDWLGSRYTVFVLAAFAASLGSRLAWGVAPGPALYSSLSLMVALSPCALVISSPAATLSALSWCARNGMLARGGAAVEASGRVTCVGLDKTGTLTYGRPELVELCVCGAVPAGAGAGPDVCWHGGPVSAEAGRVLGIAAAAEQHAGHPLAEAVVRAAREQGATVPEATSVRVLPGLGVEAEVDGKPVRIGQPKLFPSLPAEFQRLADRMREEGQTVAILEYDGGHAALGLRDGVREESREIVGSLRSLRLGPVAMLTGDNAVTASAVASQVGVDDYEAGLMPEDKVAWVRARQAEGHRVLFVGDGVNDAPVLAAADVGVGMGGLGSDVALKAAGVVLVKDNLRLLPGLVRIGRKTNRIVRANLLFAGGVVVLLAAMTFAIEAFWPGAHRWTLPFAVVGHEGSTAVVVLNGLRLLRGP